ncbi:ABC transporter [Curtobacterium sp. 'Ferrero']|uniref:ATP-binding cassette domain-containing protein n=1 Tax=Curtobacterium sp. 'Ferrero' TaxID=2033654 RepID=UPI000BDB5F8E|nr:excinuclease ABC subunit UvrA [Curtobacterium sp. 'Ferrero']PCN48070.1 ABC transporter [Curtobacterium sp. 'Ferrero']
MPAPHDQPASSPAPAPDGFIHVRGAREHNLQNVDVDIPRDRIVAFTGISGSGKSSLAFGTVFAEAQRRFLESVAPYARRLIAQGSTPHVDAITGLPPAVALQQRRGAPSTRSTVGTLTTLSNSVRMLYSRAGTYPEGATQLYSDSFSPNTVAGACPRCHGLGTAHEVTEASAVHDPSLSIREGAITAWPGAWQGKNLRDVTAVLGYDIDRPWKDLPKADRDWLLFTEEQPVVEVHPKRDRVAKPYKGRFWSARQYTLHTLADSQSETQRNKALRFVESGPCQLCGGSGLTRAALAVTFGGLSIAEFNGLPLSELAQVLRPAAELTDPTPAQSTVTSGERSEVAKSIAQDLGSRIGVLIGLGLGYLGLDRATPTLSPGETQRLRIATQLRSGLFGVVYVLDEPSAGLHPADTESLVQVLDDLRAGGNSVFVVEHDMDIVRRADWIVDVGPGAGSGGGRVLYSGPPDGLADIEESVTRRYLHPGGERPAHEPREPVGTLEIRDATLHNLDHLDLDLPLGVMSAVTGVSGSGKSSLVGGVLPTVAARHPLITRVVEVDQKPIGRTPRSNLATYTGMFDAVRQAFAATEQAKQRGWTAGRFSFNVEGGRCEVCQGEGSVSVELLFLPGSWAPCPECHGARYNAETLEVRRDGSTIADVLGMTVDEAADALADLPAAARALTALQQVGLGYLRLGQPAPELSGGEAQRIKLATELQRARSGHTLYLLDEPSTGLHAADLELLTAQLHRLVDAGNTVVVVEHVMSVVAQADHVVDLGPAGGEDGGRVVATGTPSEVAASAASRTAPYLRSAIGS